MTNELYTIGHSNHPIETFMGLLAEHRISVICDVRSTPYSRYTPHFNRDPLKQALKQAGITYGFLGRELGARSDDPNCYVKGKVQYDRLANTGLFQNGLARVQGGLQNHRIALMCAEKDPLACHRGILVCRQLRNRGVSIQHILADGTLEATAQAEERLLDLLNLFQDDFFTTRAERIEQAYDLQGGKIAFTAMTPDENALEGDDT